MRHNDAIDLHEVGLYLIEFTKSWSWELSPEINKSNLNEMES